MKKILYIIITIISISSCTSDINITEKIETDNTIISTDRIIDIMEIENQPNY